MTVPSSTFCIPAHRPSNGEIGDRRSRTDDGLTELYCIVLYGRHWLCAFYFAKKHCFLSRYRSDELVPYMQHVPFN